MTARQRLLIANWKLHKTSSEVAAFAQALTPLLAQHPSQALPQLAVCPSFTLIQSAVSALKDTPIQTGAQNMAAQEAGAWTGEVSVGQLKELGTALVILGHSERRQFFAETDALVNTKTKLALAYGLTPVVCVGETLDEREAGQTDAVVQQQTQAAVASLSDAEKAQLVFAYEPIWAIGTGKVCESAEAARVCGLIRQWCGTPETRVLYGGSMKPDNAAELLAYDDIDGGLVGGASLEAESFAQLIAIAAQSPAAVA